ncbi:unnamed protein product, partial [Iphiclides podalirius]
MGGGNHLPSGKEDIPAIVNMLDKTNEHNIEIAKSNTKLSKQTSPKKKESPKSKKCIKMDIDVLDSDIDIVKEILSKETEPKCKVMTCWLNTERRSMRSPKMYCIDVKSVMKPPQVIKKCICMF